MATIEQQIPAHVPPELVQNFTFDREPGMDTHPAEVMDSLRDGRDIVFAPAGRRNQGTWVLKNYDLIFEAYQNTELFSSYRFSGFSALLGEDWPMPPMEYDAPQHRPFRALINPLFTPKRMAMLEEGIAETVTGILDEIRPQGQCEFQSTFGLQLPTTVFLRLIGLPLEDAPTLLEWESKLMHGASLDIRIEGARAIKEYLQGHIAAREAERRDDIISYIIYSEVDGRPLTEDEKLGMCFLLYSAGLDTVAASLGFTLRYLALNPDVQEELRAHPEKRNKAIEELLRINMNNVPGRWVTQDTVFHGVEMKKGDYLSLSTMFANRDPAMFANPEKPDFERANSMRHIAFGTGAHNCLGSHLARRELRISMDAWLDQMPPFRVGAKEPVTYGGSVFGVRTLDLAWTPPA
jgi:cytochrome P450